jgi:hypothetical protein
MKTLTVQIQAGLATALEAEQAVAKLLALAGEKVFAAQGHAISAEAVKGDGCISVNFRAPDLARLWRAIQEKLGLGEDEQPPIARALIVVCEGQFGWDDYLLLHHYDEFETPDGL